MKEQYGADLREGGVAPLGRTEANYLFQVVAAKFEQSSLILTSNQAVSEWPELFSDHALATAILDHDSQVFSIKGNSYRLRERMSAASTLSAAASPSPVDASSQP